MSGAWQFPWDIPAVPIAPPADPDPDAPVAGPKPRGRRPASAIRTAAGAPDWLFHHLTISGPMAAVDAFATAARGSGITPWQLDHAAIEEDIFVRAVSQPASRRTLTVEGCRILARQFREKVEVRQARAAALVGQSFLCPFDLHALLPLPPAILLLGPTHPTALSWLAANWGITDRLRQVSLRDKATTGRRLPTGHSAIVSLPIRKRLRWRSGSLPRAGRRCGLCSSTGHRTERRRDGRHRGSANRIGWADG